MIEKIKLRNFQSHKNSEIEFGEGLNVIVGSSDSGKSSILRALSLVCSNKPSGESMVSHWAKEDGKVKGDMEVVLEVDGKEIIRRRGSSTNEYSFDGEVYKGMGSNVPRPIEEKLNLDEINVQGQHDSVFLLSDSSGEIAKKLNRVVNLDKMDVAVSNVNKWKRDTEKEKKRIDSEYIEVHTKIEDLDWIDEAKKEIEEYEYLYGLSDGKKEHKEKLRNIVDPLSQIDLSQFGWISGAEEDLHILEKLIEVRNEKKESQDRMVGIVDELDSIVIEDFDYDGLISDLNELEDIKIDREFKDHKMNALVDLVSSLKSSIRSIKKIEDDIYYEQDLFDRTMPEVCPLCGQEVKVG
jgi:DNA repair protein SbcC/Rad50